MKKIVLLIRIIISVDALYFILLGNFITAIYLLFTLGVTFIPDLLEQLLTFSFPYIFYNLICIFTFLSLYLGEVHNFYSIFWWWDLFLHFTSGILMVIMGLIILYLLDRKVLLYYKKRYFLIVFFTLMISIASACIWETLEFSCDILFSTNTQRGCLIDTMTDMIACTIGAIVGSNYLYHQLKSNNLSWIKKSILSFIENHQTPQGSIPRYTKTTKRI